MTKGKGDKGGTKKDGPAGWSLSNRIAILKKLLCQTCFRHATDFTLRIQDVRKRFGRDKEEAQGHSAKR